MPFTQMWILKYIQCIKYIRIALIYIEIATTNTLYHDFKYSKEVALSMSTWFN